MQFGISIPCSQKPANKFYTELDTCCPHRRIIFILTLSIQLHLNPLSGPYPSTFATRIMHQALSPLPRFDDRNNIWKALQYVTVSYYLDHFPCFGLCVSACPSINFWTPEPIFMKLDTYIMAPEPVSTVYFINPSHQSVCLYVYPSYRIVLKDSLLVCMCIPLSLRGNGSVKTFPRQRRIVGGADFYAVRVVSKEIRRSVLRRTSCFRRSILKQSQSKCFP
jgi:hypothetical protein